MIDAPTIEPTPISQMEQPVFQPSSAARIPIIDWNPNKLGPGVGGWESKALSIDMLRQAITLASLPSGIDGYMLRARGPGTEAVFEGFVQAAVGAQVRTWLSKAADAVDARDFGVVAGETPDDGTNRDRLQKAINACRDGNAPYGIGRLKVQAGNIHLLGQIDLPTSIVLEGCGSGYGDYSGSNINATVFWQDHPTADTIKVTTQQPVVLTGFKVKNPNGTGICISVVGAAGSPPIAHILNNRSIITNVATEGGSGGLKMVACRFYTVYDNVFTSATGDQIYLGSTDEDGDLGDFAFIKNTVLGSSTTAVGTSGLRLATQAGSVTHNKFHGCIDGISVDVVQNTGTLFIAFNSLEEQVSFGIHGRQPTPGKRFSNIVCIANQFTVTKPGSNYQSALYFEGGDIADYVRNVTFALNPINLFQGASGLNIVRILGGTNWKVHNNIVDCPIANALAFKVGGNATNVKLHNNTATQVATIYDVNNETQVIDTENNLTFSKLGAWANGSYVFVLDGKVTGSTNFRLAAGGNGALAMMLNSIWTVGGVGGALDEIAAVLAIISAADKSALYGAINKALRAAQRAQSTSDQMLIRTMAAAQNAKRALVQVQAVAGQAQANQLYIAAFASDSMRTRRLLARLTDDQIVLKSAFFS